jgi:CDP-4-dehydro-6-deoxyglucose reductase
VSHSIKLMPSGREYRVEPNERLLKAGLDAGVSLPYGCRMGTCTTCRGKVVQGTVDLGDAHPSYLTAQHRAQGYALLCQATALSDVVIEIDELPRLVPPTAFPTIVRRITRPAPDVVVLELRLPLHLNLKFAAGQYVDIILPDGDRRSYSIANPPQPQGLIDLQFHIRHMPGGKFTEPLFNELKAREKLNCEGPLGTFFLRDESSKPMVLIASGTGYAPIRSLVLDAFQRKLTRSMTLYWGARVRSELYLADEPPVWARAHENFQFVPVLSEALPPDAWTGRTGFVHRAVMADFPDLSGHQVYACGAPAMVNAARRDLVERCGLPAEEFFADSFVSQADVAADKPVVVSGG